jgi:hypothetical protein
MLFQCDFVAETCLNDVKIHPFSALRWQAFGKVLRIDLRQVERGFSQLLRSAQNGGLVQLALV